MRIAIAGAGIAGLTTALALAARGIDVEVLEQAGQLGELGAGLQLSPNGTRVLQHLGLHDALQPLVCEAALKEIRLYSSGQRWKLFDLGEDCRARFGAPYWMVHRGDLHRVLLDSVRASPRVRVQLHARVVRANTVGAQAHFTLADGTQQQVDALIASDGVHSVLREQLLGEDKARFTGLLAWRGLVPMQSLPAHLRVPAGQPVGTNWVGPGGHVITYPVRGGMLMNVVGIVERATWTTESWTQPGSQAELQADFGHWHADVRTLMGAIEQPFQWALLGRTPRPGWAQGRVCLLGDAAHPTLPFLAQGANMAIEDAAVMAACVAGAVATHGDIAQAFARFEALRFERTANIVNRSADNAARFHNPRLAEPDYAVHYINTEWESEKVRRRYDWLFDYNALEVAA